MALTDGDNGGLGATMLVSPSSGAYPVNGSAGNGFGTDGWWIILLLLLVGNGGWGMGGFGGGFGGMYEFPWLLTGQQNINANTNNGFRDAMINDGINSVRDGIGNISTQLCGATGNIQQSLCNGFAGVNATVNGGFANAETAANARQMANMNQAFGMQTAITGGLTNLSQQLSSCCCDNRLATCQTQNIIATEAAANRYADATNTRDIIDNANRGNQAILDKLCQLELDNYKTQLDAKNDLIAQLRQENLYARGQASQDVQTAELRANNATVANQLVQELRSCPIPSQPVYGTQPIFTCNSSGCGNGCGCNNF